MGYADGLLSTGERVMHREKQHWFVFVWGARYTILAVVLGVVLALLGQNLTSPVRDGLNIVAIVLFVGGVALLLWTTLRYLNQEYVLTNRRVIQVEGVLNKRAVDSSLEKINDAVLTQSVFGRVFGFGDLEVLTAAETGISRFRMLVHPVAFKKAMLDAKHEYEIDVAGGYAGGPPLRSEPTDHEGASARPDDRGAPAWPASPPPVPAAFDSDRPGPVPAAAPSDRPAPVATADDRASMGGTAPVGDDTVATAVPSSGAKHLTSDELTRTLASLADLRDRGAISADEYERKKADLLDRL